MRRPIGTHPVYWEAIKFLPPGDWELKRIYEMVDVEKGKLPKQLLSNPTKDSIPYLLIDGFLDGQPMFTEERNLPLVEESDTVLVADGSRSGLALRGVKGALGSTLLRYRAKDGHSQDFIFFLLQSLEGWLNTATIGGAVPHLDKRLLGLLQLTIPTRTEQPLLVRPLIEADEAIYAAKVEALKAQEVKSALLHNLFIHGLPDNITPRSVGRVFRQSFEFPRTWTLDKIGTLLNKVDYGTNSPSNNHRIGYPVIAIPQVVNSEITRGDFPFADVGPDEAAQLKLNSGDVLLIRTNGNPEYIGKSTVISDKLVEDHLIFASYLIRLRPEPTKLLGSYLSLFLSSPLGRRQCLACANTSAGNHNLGARAIRRMLIPRPPIDEQQIAVDLIRSTEQVVRDAYFKVELLTRLKQSMLQNFLTGKVRLQTQGKA